MGVIGRLRAVNPVIENELHQQLNRMDVDGQQRVLNFARALAAKDAHGLPGKSLVHLSGVIERSDLALIERAIEAGCEQVNPDEW